MSDLHPNMPGERGSGSRFRMSTNRRQDLTAQMELDAVAMKSLTEISQRKEHERDAHADNTIRKLAQEFVPQRNREKIKMHPIFHDDLGKNSQIKTQRKPSASHHYNPLDKDSDSLRPGSGKTRKLPFSRNDTVTPKEMKRAKTSAVGVVPPRDSNKVESLNVILQGKTARALDQDPVIGAVERANITTPEENANKDLLLSPARDCLKQKEVKPAILAGIGTLQAPVFTERPAPPAKPKTKLKTRNIRISSAESAKSETSSFKSTDIHIPQEAVHVPSRENSADTIKSTKDLLEEAKQLTTPDGKVHKHSRRKHGQKEYKEANTQPTSNSGEEKEQSTERNVDAIISALYENKGTKVISEADKKINEIMQRVLARTNAVLGDFAQGSENEDKEDSIKDDDMNKNPIEEVATTSQQSLQKEDSFVSVGQAEDPIDTDITQTVTTEPGCEESTGDDQTEIEAEGFKTPTVIREALEMLAELEKVPPLDIDEKTTTQSSREQTPDLTQAWQDLMAPANVTYEDMIGINAPAAEIHPRSTLMSQSEPENRQDSAQHLSTWVPVSSDGKIDTHRPKGKSVHHFCTMTGDIQVPDYCSGVWRRYHVPSKFGLENLLPQPSTYQVPSRLATLENSQRPETQFTSKTVLTGQSKSSKLSRKGASGKTRDQIPSVLESMNSADRQVLEKQQSAAANRIMEEATAAGMIRTLDDWQTMADQMFEQQDISVNGVKMEIKDSESVVYWSPAPPKWYITPSKVKEKLFPQYHGAMLTGDGEMVHTIMEESDESEIEEESDGEQMDPDDIMARDRVLARQHGSTEDLTYFARARKQRDQDGGISQLAESKTTSSWTVASESLATGRTSSVKKGDDKSQIRTSGERSQVTSTDPSDEPKVSFAELRAKFVQQTTSTQLGDEHSEKKRDDIVHVFLPRRRRHSAPVIMRGEDDDNVLVYEDFTAAMTEIKKQKQQLREIKAGRMLAPGQIVNEDEEMQEDIDAAVEHAPPEAVAEVDPTHRKPHLFDDDKDDKPTPAELALEAGRAYVILPSKKKKKRKTKAIDVSRIEALQDFLHSTPNNLERSESTPLINIQPERELKVPPKVKSRRRGSVPDVIDFEDYKKRKGYRKESNGDEREFARNIWNQWFDQTFPPTPAESDWEDDEPQEETPVEEKPKRRASHASTVFSGADLEVYPVIEDEDDVQAVEIMEEEFERLNNEIVSQEEPNAFLFARRGALCRKLGKIGKALEDLNMAIELEPALLDAYWHRHLVYMLENKKQQALDDLNFLLKHNKTHAGAYRSRAQIHRETGDVTMAIVNYTQAIKLDPEDYEAYYQRAEMYEKRGEMLLAMEDYAIATKLMPSKTEALFKHGLHYFKNGNWQSSIQDFTELLKQDPQDSRARTYRGRAYAKLQQWNSAVQDLSAAIHLNPRNSIAFYCRGCILRKLHPKRALQDFSVSLMLDDSEENMLAYLHRGILYNEIGKHEDAVPDFEAVLKLDKDMAVAHVNLGLIFMLKMENYHRAIKKFTGAIKADPTYLKAYVCRAEAFTKIHDFKNALLDFTRAIHLRPDVHHYYMYRGQLVLKMGDLELAAFCVKHAAELNESLGQSPTQQAIVQSFLKNYDKAITALEGATRVQPVAPLFLLLGKTQMKARLWKDAVVSFERALDIVKPWKPDAQWPIEAAEMFFLIGLSQMENKEFLAAHEGFNSAIKVDPNHADAYYHRGLTRMRLKQNKGVQDFNRALALNPTLFQAYLSRACFYGLRKQYSKAILNCNEAIKLQPNSVRGYLYRGALKYHIKSYTLAIRDLSIASTIDNKCGLAYFNRAVCYHDSGSYVKALQDYGIVLLLGDQLKLKVHINRGLLYFSRKDFKNALKDFLLASKMDSKNKLIYHTLGLCYHKLERLKEAVESFTKAIQLDQFFIDAYIGRGNAFMDYGHDVGLMYARRDYQRVLMMDACCLPARVNLAYNLQVCGKFWLAWQQFTSAVNINSEYQPALEGRSIINLQMSDTVAAFQDISASVKVKPSAELLTNRGVIHQFMGDRVNAMRDYQEAIKLDATYSLAYFNAANVYFHMRQFKQARAYYSAAIQYNEKDESAFVNRAITKVMLKDSEGALKDFNSAITLSPKSAHIYFNRANLYASVEDYFKAEEDYTKALSLKPGDALALKRRADVIGKQGKRQEAIADYKQAIEIQSKKKFVI